MTHDSLRHDLHLVPFGDLLAEVVSRCDAIVIGAELKVPAGTEDGANVWTWHEGGRLKVRGLLADLDDYVRHVSRGPVGIDSRGRH